MQLFITPGTGDTLYNKQNWHIMITEAQKEKCTVFGNFASNVTTDKNPWRVAHDLRPDEDTHIILGIWLLMISWNCTSFTK